MSSLKNLFWLLAQANTNPYPFKLSFVGNTNFRLSFQGMFVFTCFSFLRLSFSLMFWSVSNISSNSSMALWEDATFCCSNSALLIWWQNVWTGTGTRAESLPWTLETPSMGTWGQVRGKTSVCICTYWMFKADEAKVSLWWWLWFSFTWSESINYIFKHFILAQDLSICTHTCTVRRYCIWSLIALSRYSGTERMLCWWSIRNDTSLVANSSSRSHSTALPRTQPENVWTIWKENHKKKPYRKVRKSRAVKQPLWHTKLIIMNKKKKPPSCAFLRKKRKERKMKINHWPSGIKLVLQN